MLEERVHGMTSVVALQDSQTPWEPPAAPPLDEAVWQAWMARGRAKEERGREAHLKAAKWISIVVLLAVAGLWSYAAPFEIAVRFIVAGSACIVTAEAFQTRRYALAVGFGALALLYNPVAPVFSFAGDWQRGLVIASAIPFFVSLTWRKAKR
jgi:hypothetical protein